MLKYFERFEQWCPSRPERRWDYVISEENDNEDEGNTGWVWMNILYKPQQLIHWYIAVQLIVMYLCIF